MKTFINGFKGMLPIVTGIVPFGLVMGTVCASSGLSLSQSVLMNIFVFAGASQLAALDLMLNQTATAVVLATGLIINIRFILYSAALSPVVHNSNFLTKLFSAYLLTDQNFAVMSAHEGRLQSNSEKIIFYFGASLCMCIAWHGGVILGVIFGNFAPASWSLDYAIPLSFIALVIPTLKNKLYVYVALLSFTLSILLKEIPYNLGLIISALIGIGFGALFTFRRARND